jgi:hypothetical protein
MIKSPVQWDGCDDLGNNMPQGVYFVRIVSDKGTVTEKVILK